MEETVFQGENPLVLDAKGRISLPVKLRPDLGEALTLTKHPHGCVLVFPRADWLAFRPKLLRMKMSALGWRRMLLGGAVDVDLDSASRLLVPPALRTWAGLDRDLLLVGMGRYYELWDQARHAVQEARTVAEEMPAGLEDLVL